MPPYITMADLSGLIPCKFLIEGLDDDGDGAADPTAINLVCQGASDAVDSILGGRFETPFAMPIPKVVTEAAKIFACEMIHQRRGKSADENPFTKQANQLRDPETGKLTLIAKGEQPLTPQIQRAKPSGTVIAAPAKTSSATGKTSV